MQKVSVKFYSKNANDDAFAAYRYIGSMSVESTLRGHLIASAESIAGPVNGPLVAMIDGQSEISVLKV